VLDLNDGEHGMWNAFL